MKKIMVYSVEDGSYGYKPAKFDFKKGTRLVSNELGKFIKVEGVFDFSDSGFLFFKRLFLKIKRSRASFDEKVSAIILSAIRYSGEDGKELAEIKLRDEEKEMTETLDALFFILP